MADQYSLKAVLSAVDKMSPVLNAVNAAAKTTRKYLGDVGNSINGLASKFGIPLGIVSTIAAGFGIGAIKKAVVAFTDLGEEVQKGAFKAGMSNAEYQRMKYVTEQAGLGAEAMQASMGKLNKNIGAAVSGKNKDLVSLFQTLHIPLKDANGQIRSAADMLPQLADAFVKNQDPVKQAAIGTALFGKAYQEMLPFLNEGSDGITKSLERFSKLKGVISDEDLSGAKDFGDKLNDLNFITKGFQMTIAKELVPVLSPMVEQFIQWAAVNKKLIGGEVKKIVQELVAAVKSVDWNVFVQGVKDTVASIGGFIDKVGGLKNALILLAVVMNIQTIAATVGMIGSLGRLGLAMVGVTMEAGAASLALGKFAASQSVGTALTASLASAAKSAGLLAAAALIGAAIGTAIYKVLLEDTRVGDWIGEKIARVAAFFGNEEAKASLKSMEDYAKSLPPVVPPALPQVTQITPAAAPALVLARTPAVQTATKALLGAPTPRQPIAPAVSVARTPVAQTAAKALLGAPTAPLPVRPAVQQVVQPAVSLSRAPAVQKLAVPASRLVSDPAVKSIVQTVPVPKLIGDPTVRSLVRTVPAIANDPTVKSFATEPPRALGPQLGAPRPLTTPSANVNASIDVRFKDSPPGMKVEESRATNPRVAVTTDVGYRTLGTGYAF